ncbi:hypothetical protein ACOMHN_061458 [Nucella lapillus]
MRGSKNGVEKKLRDENRHLLDIGGDTVHVVNNAVKKFCSTYLQDFCKFLFYDLCDSPKAKDIFYPLMGLRPKVVLRPISSRFLQMLGVSEQFLELQNPIFLYYSSFLTPSEDTKEIQDIIEEIYSTNNIAEEARTAI